MTTRRRRAAALALALGLALASVPPGCVSVGRASWKAYSTTGEWFADNPAAWIPYWIGFGIFGIVCSPLDLISWPLTLIFFPDEKEEPSREFYLFSAISPTILGGSGGGTLLGAIFYPFGMPFMKSEGEKTWNDAKPAPEDQELPPPPGGDAPPKKSGK